MILKKISFREVNAWNKMIEESLFEQEIKNGLFLHRMINHKNYKLLTKKFYLKSDLFESSKNPIVKYGWSHGPLSLIIKIDMNKELIIERNKELKAKLILIKGNGNLIYGSKNFEINEGVFVDIKNNTNWKFISKTQCIIIWKGVVNENNLAKYLERNFLEFLPETIESIKSFRPEFKKTIDLFW